MARRSRTTKLASAIRPKLYHNNHDGTFTDVSAKSGLNFCGWGYGVAIGDYDNDGWEDVYITGYHGSALYHNNHDGTFTDVTAKAGVANADRMGNQRRVRRLRQRRQPRSCLSRTTSMLT